MSMAQWSRSGLSLGARTSSTLLRRLQDCSVSYWLHHSCPTVRLCPVGPASATCRLVSTADAKVQASLTVL